MVSDKKNTTGKGVQKGADGKGTISFDGKPQFGRSKNMGNKMEFPELDQPASNKGGHTAAN
ncbi:MAG: hypothetical protein ACMG6E_09435 [Candidatus Roizmanbacteria bacterium]